MKKKLVITDFGFLPENINFSWVAETKLDYIIFDRKHRYDKSKFKNIIYQKNFGQNIYDILDYIVNNYNNLEDILIFCKGSVMFPKNRKKPLHNGHCSKEKFFKLIKNFHLTEIHDYETEYQNGKTSYIDSDGGYNEINNSWYLRKHRPKYFITFDLFMNYIFINYEKNKFNRFAPGANYLVPKKNILYYDVNFYKLLRKFVSWDVIVGEAHIIERALYYIFSNKYQQRDKFGKFKLFFNVIFAFVIFYFFYQPIEKLKYIIKHL